LDTAARGVPEFTAHAKSFKDSVDYCALIPLQVFFMNNIRFWEQNSEMNKEKGNRSMIGM
jgi:hypothetical protein